MGDRCMNLEGIASSCPEEFIESPQGEASFFQSDHVWKQCALCVYICGL